MTSLLSHNVARQLPKASARFNSQIARTFTSAAQLRKGPILLQDKDDGFGFIRHNPRNPKPRKTGVTEIRGPYYSAYGKRHLQDVLETMGYHVDGLKFAGGTVMVPG